MCNKCVDGWIVTDAGAKRCSCVKPVDRTPKPPILTVEHAKFFTGMLAAIPYFPSEEGARTAIGDEIRSMCSSLGEAEWLVKRMIRLYERWPGPQEMRRVYGSKHIPRDGVMPIGISEAYPDGIPSEKESRNRQIEAPKMKELPAGAMQSTVRDLAAEMPVMPKAKPGNDRFSRTLEDTLTAPQDRPELHCTPQIITQADIDRAVEELRAKRCEAMRTDANPSEPMRSDEDQVRQEKQERRSA